MAQNVIINSVTYSDVPQVEIPKSGSGTAVFYDTEDADAGQGDVLSDKTYYKSGKKTGSMPNNGSTSGTISTKDGTVAIPAGYTSGGAPYGVTWEQVGIDSELPYDEKVRLYMKQMDRSAELLEIDDDDELPFD